MPCPRNHVLIVACFQTEGAEYVQQSIQSTRRWACRRKTSSDHFHLSFFDDKGNPQCNVLGNDCYCRTRSIAIQASRNIDLTKQAWTSPQSCSGETCRMRRCSLGPDALHPTTLSGGGWKADDHPRCISLVRPHENPKIANKSLQLRQRVNVTQNSNKNLHAARELCQTGPVLIQTAKLLLENVATKTKISKILLPHVMHLGITKLSRSHASASSLRFFKSNLQVPAARHWAVCLFWHDVSQSLGPRQDRTSCV